MSGNTSPLWIASTNSYTISQNSVSWKYLTYLLYGSRFIQQIQSPTSPRYLGEPRYIRYSVTPGKLSSSGAQTYLLTPDGSSKFPVLLVPGASKPSLPKPSQSSESSDAPDVVEPPKPSESPTSPGSGNPTEKLWPRPYTYYVNDISIYTTETDFQSYIETFHQEIVIITLGPSLLDDELQVATVVFKAVPSALANMKLYEFKELDDKRFWKGFNMSERDGRGRTPLSQAAVARNYPLVEMLLQFPGVDVNSVDNAGQTALHLACLKVDKVGETELDLESAPDIVQFLLEMPGLRIDIKDSEGKTAYDIARGNKLRDTGLVFLVHVAKLNSYGHSKDVALERLLTMSTAPYHPSVREYDPKGLLRVAESGNVELARAMIFAGGNVNTSELDQMRTPLWVAAKNGHERVAKAFIVAGAVVNAADDQKLSPLMIAAQKGHHGMVDVLIKAGADVNAQNNRTDTALHLAAIEGHRAVIERLLLSPHIDVNQPGVESHTALHHAVKGNNSFSVQPGERPEGDGRDWVGVVRLLMRAANINPAARTSSGQTAREIAQKWGYRDLEALLVVPE